jgi:hypothetical protein
VSWHGNLHPTYPGGCWCHRQAFFQNSGVINISDITAWRGAYVKEGMYAQFSDWIVFAKNNDGDAFARVSSMEDRPTCQNGVDCTNGVWCQCGCWWGKEEDNDGWDREGGGPKNVG